MAWGLWVLFHGEKDYFLMAICVSEIKGEEYAKEKGWKQYYLLPYNYID